ncbi:MAG TPA: GAF domain-containing protein [Ignavibacteria bacterium]|nr:GAF domain-containing protein [Ignavibacteria bacterium]HMR41043.1 GAF domain-containing protein [Ignavibacteria bacterium]
MSFELKTHSGISKQEKYELLLPQIDALIDGEPNLITNLANITSALKYSMDNFLWVGFYLSDNLKTDELVLGPFQGRVACTRIPFGKGVCGSAAEAMQTVIVDDVDKFPGHIVCDSLSRSEIVIPVIKDNRAIAILDIDSDKHSNFDETDKKYLEKIINNINHIF